MFIAILEIRNSLHYVRLLKTYRTGTEYTSPYSIPERGLFLSGKYSALKRSYSLPLRVEGVFAIFLSSRFTGRRIHIREHP